MRDLKYGSRAQTMGVPLGDKTQGLISPIVTVTAWGYVQTLPRRPRSILLVNFLGREHNPTP